MVTDERTRKALQIASRMESSLRIGKNNYRVRSQSEDKFHTVRKLSHSDTWLCECKDFMSRLVKGDEKPCKHILYVQILQGTVEQELHIEKLDVPKICPKCNSTTIAKNGFRTVQNEIKRQRYQCKQCRH